MDENIVNESNSQESSESIMETDNDKEETNSEIWNYFTRDKQIGNTNKWQNL